MAWVRFGLAWLSSAKLGLRLGLGLGISLSLGLSLGAGLFSAPFSLAWSCSGSVSPQPALLSLAGFGSHFNTFTDKNHDNLQNCAITKLDDWILLREWKIQVRTGLGLALLQLV